MLTLIIFQTEPIYNGATCLWVIIDVSKTNQKHAAQSPALTTSDALSDCDSGSNLFYIFKDIYQNV